VPRGLSIAKASKRFAAWNLAWLAHHTATTSAQCGTLAI
jgi:hypothetical protein